MTDSAPVDPYSVATFEQFWPHYVRLHRRPETHRWHAVATSSSALLIGLAVAARNPWFLLAAPLTNHFIAQTSHRRFERNRTLPWRNTVWHTRAELRMFRLVLAGRMRAEVERCRH
jgi:hypothetical protein